GSSPGFIEVSVCWGTQQSAHRSRGPAAPAIRLAAALRVLYSPTRKLRGARSGGERVNGTEFLLGPEALARHGERVALVCGAESVTYAELARQSALAAAAYASLGVKPGDKVLLLMRDTPQFAAAWLGLVRMGAVAVALNNKVSEAEYRHVLADSEARLALVEDVFVEARRDLSAELAAQGRLVVAGDQASSSDARAPRWQTLLASARPGSALDVAPEWPAFYLYSSGTTGRAKGIVHSHHAVTCVGAALRLLGVRAGE